MPKTVCQSILASLMIILSGLTVSSCSQWVAAFIRTSPTTTLQTPSPQPATTIPATPSPFTTTISFSLAPSIQTPSPTESITVNPTETIFPSKHYILDISGHKQYFAIGCEASAAVDWAAYFGVHINEFNFQYEMPLSDNPDYGFVGDVRGPWGQVPPYAYGVYAGPVATALQKHGLPAKGTRAFTIDQIKSEIAKDHPVIAWVIGNVVGGVPSLYTDAEGRKTIVAAYEHVVIVTGYNDKSIRYMTNGKFFETPTEVFENSWNVLENMVIYYSK